MMKSNKLLNERQVKRLLGRKDIRGLTPDVVRRDKNGRVELFYHVAEVKRHKAKAANASVRL